MRARPSMRAPRTDLDWLEGHFDALYALDDVGRMTARAAPDSGPPPRFHFARTRLGASWRFSAALPGELVRELARYAALEPGVVLDARHPPLAPDRLEPMRRALEAMTPIEATFSGPAFRLLADASARALVEAAAVDVETASAPGDPRLVRWADELGEPLAQLEAALPVAVSCFEGRAVSSCRVARGCADGFVEAGVATVEAARGRGHAPRCAAAWALAVEARGGAPLYSTQWSNRGSRRVAEKIGGVIFAEDWHFR